MISRLFVLIVSLASALMLRKLTYSLMMKQFDRGLAENTELFPVYQEVFDHINHLQEAVFKSSPGGPVSRTVWLFLC